MSRLVRMTLEEAKRISSKTDWDRVDAMTDEEIEKAIKEDTDSVPELTEEWFKNAQWVRERKESIPVYLDHSVAEFLKHRGANYHFWLNEMLKDLMRLTTGSGNGS